MQPNALESRIEEIFNLLPMEKALTRLAPRSPFEGEATARVSSIQASPEVLAGLWLYVDDLDRSHAISQGINTPTGSFWHAIMHRREGDFSNSKYWLRNVGRHPVIDAIGYDPFEFVDACQSDRDRNSPELVEMQRKEWKTLFDHCRGVGDHG